MVHVSDYVLGRLRDWGIRRVDGYPGDGIDCFAGFRESIPAKGW